MFEKAKVWIKSNWKTAAIGAGVGAAAMFGVLVVMKKVKK